MTKLEKAIKEARKIRRNLVRQRRAAFKNLQGECGLASLMLAYQLDDVSILRAYEGHAWNEVDKVVIDITATQFDSGIRGTYVGPGRDFHMNATSRGKKAVKEIFSWNCYNEEKFWPKIKERFR